MTIKLLSLCLFEVGLQKSLLSLILLKYTYGMAKISKKCYFSDQCILSCLRKERQRHSKQGHQGRTANDR